MKRRRLEKLRILKRKIRADLALQQRQAENGVEKLRETIEVQKRKSDKEAQ
jgi:hypothetical protein